MRWAFFLAASLVPCAAQAQLVTVDPIEEMASKADTTRQSEDANKRQLLIVPIPQSDPALGTGGTLVAAMFWNPKKEPEPWISGVGLMRTNNGSRAIGALHKMSLGQDKLRFVFFAGKANINIKFYGIGPDAGDRGRAVELEEKGWGTAFQGLYRVAPHLYVGGRFLYFDFNTGIHRSNPNFPDEEVPQRDFNSRLASGGPMISYDSRDNFLFPRNGEVLTLALRYASTKSQGDLFNDDRHHYKVTLEGNVYRSLGKSTVVAGRVSVCGVTKDAPFYDLCLYGAKSDLRGYDLGRFRDRASWAAQVELRQHLFWKLGAAVFGGIGQSSPNLGHLFGGKFLPAAGAGLRFKPLKSNPINIRVDYAVGKDSNGLYVSVGEAF